jgi:hypothetical protein
MRLGNSSITLNFIVFLFDKRNKVQFSWAALNWYINFIHTHFFSPTQILFHEKFHTIEKKTYFYKNLENPRCVVEL